MIDTHSHIYVEDFEQDLDDVVQRALQVGIDKIFLPNINEESIAPMFSLAERYPNTCYPMIGLHPEDVKENWQPVLERMAPYLSKVIAVGEAGLDFYWDATYKKEQIEAFEYQLSWAKEHRLPIVIHMRKAEPELLDAMERHKSDGLKGIFHCFSGSTETATRLLKYEGFALGIGGVLTFKNCHLSDTLQKVPLERIVLETDAPYLAPVPHRGKRNEPSFVYNVAQKIAEIYGVPLEEVNSTTNTTVENIFGKL